METTFIRTLNSNDNCENFCYYLVFGFMVFLMSHSWLCAGGVWETIWGARDLKLRTVQCKHLTHQTLVLFLNPFTEMENTIKGSIGIWIKGHMRETVKLKFYILICTNLEKSEFVKRALVISKAQRGWELERIGFAYTKGGGYK